MLFDALTATIAHLAVGLLFAAILFFIAVLIHSEAKRAREAELAEPEIEMEDIWAGLTPDRDLRRAETHFDSERDAA